MEIIMIYATLADVGRREMPERQRVFHRVYVGGSRVGQRFFGLRD